MDISDLSNLQLDVLGEIGNIGAGNAATALAKMLNKKVNMDVPKVKVLEFKEVADILGGAEIPVVGILLNVTGELKGNMIFILEYSEAQELLDMLIGSGRQQGFGVFSELELSALKEIGNILASSYLSALSSLANLTVVPSVPDIAIDMAGAILSVPAIEFGKTGDTVLYIETEFMEGNTKVVGNFFLVPDVNSYFVLLKALGVIR